MNPHSRWIEARALLDWIMRSWRQPADTPAGWEQRAGHERADARPVAATGSPPQGQTGGATAQGSRSSQTQGGGPR